MRETVPQGGAIPGGSGEEMFSGLLDQHIADDAAQRTDRGIGEALYRHFVGLLPDDPEA
jgi:flagellar protein FlgJ